MTSITLGSGRINEQIHLCLTKQGFVAEEARVHSRRVSQNEYKCPTVPISSRLCRFPWRIPILDATPVGIGKVPILEIFTQTTYDILVIRGKRSVKRAVAHGLPGDVKVAVSLATLHEMSSKILSCWFRRFPVRGKEHEDF